MGGFVIVFIGIVAYLGGFLDSSVKTDADTETAVAANAQPETPPTGTKSTFAKNTFEGTVTGIVSGDTITVVDKYKQEYTIRLSGIEAPAASQFFGEESKTNLSDLALDKTVLVMTEKIEENGSVIAKVLVRSQNLSLEQIRAGFAAHTQDSAKDQTEQDRLLYADAEQLAKSGGFGIWSSSNPEVVSAPAADGITYPADPLRTLHGGSVWPQNGNVSPGQEASTVDQPRETQVSTIAPTPADTEPKAAQPEPVASPPAVTKSEAVETKAPSSSAIARCADGSLYYGATRRGACSGRGGVADWLGGASAPAKSDTTSRKYMLGPRGGCYYTNSKGGKSYVDKSLCN